MIATVLTLKFSTLADGHRVHPHGAFENRGGTLDGAFLFSREVFTFDAACGDGSSSVVLAWEEVGLTITCGSVLGAEVCDGSCD